MDPSHAGLRTWSPGSCGTRRGSPAMTWCTAHPGAPRRHQRFGALPGGETRNHRGRMADASMPFCRAGASGGSDIDPLACTPATARENPLSGQLYTGLYSSSGTPFDCSRYHSSCRSPRRTREWRQLVGRLDNLGSRRGSRWPRRPQDGSDPAAHRRPNDPVPSTPSPHRSRPRAPIAGAGNG